MDDMDQGNMDYGMEQDEMMEEYDDMGGQYG